ncbi:uncharacterized protein LOC111636027 [Centruroides sculpturatus]|uniref:uncharacterized protein LOC111636027 n=1 Tax=Centruroides sculpturatus TaxID=218467 RepID=UPI000C6CB0CA|nr:uncharacterized protein LOC111636027 [Centruroides sculpturatus]
MRWVIFLQFLFLVVNSCQEFWQHWGNVSCLSSSADSCYESKNFSFVEILNQSLSIKCGEETIDSRLMRCLDVRNVQEITFTNCYMSGIDFGIFTFGYEIGHVKVLNPSSYKRNFESASFSNMSFLRSVEIRGVNTSKLLNLTFHNVPSLTSLRIIQYNFTLFPNKPFRELINLSELVIKFGRLIVLPEDLFYNLCNLKKLHLSLNIIESISPLVFRNLTRLEYLDLEWNQIKALPSDMLKGLSTLKIFSVSGNHELSEIPSGFFKKMHNLTHFSAWSCSISSLEEDVFSDLFNLKIVYLNFNKIQHLSPNLLRNNKLLTQFSCSYNKISTLPTGIFNGLSELRELDLRGNQLENLPEDVFQNLSSLQSLDLSKNLLTFLHENIFFSLSNLTILDLSYNNLTEITGKILFGSSKHLRTLRLKNAGLTRWPVINWTEYNLTEVDFSNNHFEIVKLSIYTPNRMQIDLSNCKIRTIYMDEWKYGYQMTTYDLRSNEITCNFELQQFVSAIKSNREVASKMFPNIEKTKCYGEERNLLDNTSFVVIENYCPMNCECFDENNYVVVNCSGKGIERIPEVLVPNATIVDLSNNYINYLSNVDCVTWKNVTHLRLSNNSISNISDYVFLPNLKWLWLDGNRLTQLPSVLMNLIDVSPEFNIYLSRNNFNCDCNSQFNRDWLLRNKQKIADFFNINCRRNSSFLSFIDIVSNDGCTEISEINLAFSVSDSSSNESRIFHGLSELRELNLRGNRLENLPEDVFQNLSSLQSLDLSKNLLTFLHENIFLPLINLTLLDLSNNNLTKLTGEHPFGSSKHLRTLRLNNAGLTQWPVLDWTEYYLTAVDFSNNRFETAKMLIYTPNRLKIQMTSFKIKTIYIDEWKYEFQMPTYDLSNNEITCDHKLQQFVSAFKSNREVANTMFPSIENTKCYGEERNLLDYTAFVVIGNYCPMNCECFDEDNHVLVNCSGKRIVRIPEVLVPNATIVNLSNNYIKDLSNIDFFTWNKVTHLRLSNNSISNIQDYVFLPNLKSPWLDGNQLTELLVGLMNLIDISPEFKLYLSRNDLTCHCHSQFTKVWLLRNRQKIADFPNIYCRRNSSFLSFIDIVSNDECGEISKDKFGVIIAVSIVYYRRRRSDKKEPNTHQEEMPSPREQQIEGKTLLLMASTKLSSHLLLCHLNRTFAVPFIFEVPKCYISNRHSSVEIFNNSLSVTCSDKQTIDIRLMHCLNAKYVKHLAFIDCYLARFAVERFASTYAIEKIFIKYKTETLSFDSASFINMSSLKYLEIEGVRTFDVFNLSFPSDSSLISLKISKYNFTSFLHRPFQQLKNLSELQLNFGKLKTLPEELFHGLYNLKTLDLSYNLIEFVHPSFFQHFTLLEQLNLEGNPIKSFPENLLKGLSTLRNFSISGHFSELRSAFLKELDNLTEFRASYFPLLQIEEDFFSNCMNLRKVDFYSNDVLHLPSNLLKNCKNLEVFQYSRNKLSTLPNGIFDGPYKLKKINFHENRLENIAEDTFQRLSNLEELVLSSNRLTFLPKNIFLPTKNLRILSLSHNNFSKISFDFNNNLEELYLGGAGLTEWPNLNWTNYNLTYIYAPFNYFEIVKLPIYTPNRMKIDLDFCLIKTIYIDEWKYGFNKPNYQLGRNPITCNGELLHFVSTVQSNLEISLQIFPDVKDMKCHGEERKLLDFTQFFSIKSHCPLNCECFSENDNLKVDCNGKGIKKLPEFLIENATIVDLSNNYISDFSTVDSRTWNKVTRLHLSNNSLFRFSDYVLMPNMKFLWLDGNRLTELPSGLMNLIDVSAEFTVYLSRNNWTCDCHSRFTKDWLLRNKLKIADFSEVLCTKNSSVFSFTSIVFNSECMQISCFDEAGCTFGWKIAVTVLTSLTLLGLITVVVFVYCHKKRNIEKVAEPKEEKVIYYNVDN